MARIGRPAGRHFLRYTPAVFALIIALPAAAQEASPLGTLMSAASGGPRGVADMSTDVAAFAKAAYAVHIDLDRRELEFRHGDEILWSAPIGIGSGIHLVSDAGEWDFSTPPGDYRVEFKELDPVWITPDWFFLERNLPVPPWDDVSRRIPGGLGRAAIYFAPSLAIHGTAGPGVGVSHGCVRLLDRYVMRLYHNVEVGTPVVIVGGESAPNEARVVDLRDGYDASIAPSPPSPPPADPLRRSWRDSPTGALLLQLDEQLALPAAESRWDEVVGLLVQRGRDDDDEALTALLARSAELPSLRVEREWPTILAYAYRRSPVRTLEALGSLHSAQRDRAALLIASATVAQFGGDPDEPTLPWPTRRIPESMVTAGAMPGWNALRAAERSLRDSLLADIP
jgi:hypothetical protein